MKTQSHKKKSTRKGQMTLADILIGCVPTTWLDDLLTGPTSALKRNGAGYWGCPDVERLLNAIRARMIAAKRCLSPRVKNSHGVGVSNKKA